MAYARLAATLAIVASVLVTVASPAAIAGEDVYKFRARFWDWSSFSADLQKEINEIVADEQNATYAFANGAVSRDLGDKMVAEWQQGRATTISQCVKGWASHPGGSGNFTVCPGEHKEFPGLVYFEDRVRTAVVIGDPDPQFVVEFTSPPGCDPAYFTRLTTRTNVDGENEIRRSLARGAPGHNLNFILKCDN